MIYNAGQIGLNINLSDLAFHTYFDLSNYVAKILKEDNKEEVPAQSISELRKGQSYG